MHPLLRVSCLRLQAPLATVAGSIAYGCRPHRFGGHGGARRGRRRGRGVPGRGRPLRRLRAQATAGLLSRGVAWRGVAWRDVAWRCTALRSAGIAFALAWPLTSAPHRTAPQRSVGIAFAQPQRAAPQQRPSPSATLLLLFAAALAPLTCPPLAARTAGPRLRRRTKRTGATGSEPHGSSRRARFIVGAGARLSDLLALSGLLTVLM